MFKRFLRKRMVLMDKAIFLDRDGVVNEVLSERVKFVNQPKDFYLLEGVGEAVKLLNDANYKVFIVTNQGGVGLGYMQEAELQAIHDEMKKQLSLNGAHITDIAYCPHKPQEGCSCRKPNPEMLLKLAEKYGVNMGKSFMVGDRKQDIEAGEKAGATTVLVGNRKEKVEANHYFKDLLSFTTWLLQ